MKSQKAKEFIDGCMAHLTVEMSDHAKWQLRTAMIHAVELAEQEMEEKLTRWNEQIARLTQWRDIHTDASGFATDNALDDIFRKLPRLVRDKRDGSIELIDYDNAAEWRGDLERKPSHYQWRPINE